MQRCRWRLVALLTAALVGACADDMDRGTPQAGGGSVTAHGSASGGGGGPGTTPGTLQGLDAVEVAQLLGPSSFRRTDGPSEMLQYRNDTCVLDVFVYHDAEPARVRHVEARDHRLAPMPEGDCLRALIRSKGA